MFLGQPQDLTGWKINIYFFQEQFIIIEIHLQRVQLAWKLKSTVIAEVRVQTPSVLKFSGLPTQLFKKLRLSRQPHDFFSVAANDQIWWRRFQSFQWRPVQWIPLLPDPLCMLTDDDIHSETKMASYQDTVAPHKDWPVSVTLVPSFAATASNAS